MQIIAKLFAAVILVAGLATIGFAAYQMSSTPSDGTDLKAAVAETGGAGEPLARVASASQRSDEPLAMPDAQTIIAEVRAKIAADTGMTLPDRVIAPRASREVSVAADQTSDAASDAPSDEGTGMFGFGALVADWGDNDEAPDQATVERQVAAAAQQIAATPQPQRAPVSPAPVVVPAAGPRTAPMVSQGLPGNGVRIDERTGLPQIQARRRGPIGRPQTGASILLKSAPKTTLPETAVAAAPIAAQPGAIQPDVQSGGLQIDIGHVPSAEELRAEIEARLKPTYTATPCEEDGVPGVEIARECITVEAEQISLEEGQAHLLAEFVDFPNVREISMQGEVGSLKILKEFENLDTLWLFIAEAEDYEVLAELPHLRSLSLDRTDVTDISFLKGMTQLDRLTLVEGPFTDLDVIAGLTNIRDLELRKLDISDLSPIAGMSGLEEIYLADMPVTDLSPLSGMTALLQVKLRGMPISDLSPLANATEVRKLLIDEAEVADITPLQAMRNLTSVDLSSNPLSDLSPLAGLQDLRHVAVRKTEVVDVAVLASLPKLRSLHLDDTNVADVSALEGSERLARGSLSLRRTPAEKTR